MTHINYEKESISFIMGALLRRKKLTALALIEPFNVTLRQYVILSRLWHEGRQSLMELAKQLYADPPSLSRTILRLEKSGLIQRERDSVDRRIFTLQLSESGRQLIGRIKPILAEYEKQMMAGLSSEEILVVTAAMRKMIHNLEDIAEAQDARQRPKKSEKEQ